MSDHSGYFCQQCLSNEHIFPGTCEVCYSTMNMEHDRLYGRLHQADTGVYETAKEDNDGETIIIFGLYHQGMLPYEYSYYRTRGLLVMRDSAPIHDKAEFHAALDHNLMVWKLPVLRGLTRNFCEPLAVLARTRVITVTIAKVILLLVGNCLRDKKEVLRLMDSVVYPENSEMKYHN